MIGFAFLNDSQSIASARLERTSSRAIAFPAGLLGIGLMCLLVLGGCSSPVNPSFALSVETASSELKKMQAEPRPLERPIVVVDGYLGTGLSSGKVAGNLRKLSTDPKKVITVTLFWCSSFEECRQEIVRAVDAAFPCDDSTETCEVDVVGISMGGLAARYAAVPAESGTTATDEADSTAANKRTGGLPSKQAARKRLKIARLFTLASPHRGAIAASLPFVPAIPVDMRLGSAFLSRLNDAALAGAYPIIPYGRLSDTVVGVEQTAPPGQIPIWVPVAFMEAAHAGVAMDPRITADIARRLRGETPYATEPRAPLPQRSKSGPEAQAKAHGRPAAIGL